jgi:hypothetical protein
MQSILPLSSNVAVLSVSFSRILFTGVTSKPAPDQIRAVPFVA